MKKLIEYINNKINNIFIQLINSFEYLERNNICHRDIRINNILVTNDGILKLIAFDFLINRFQYTKRQLIKLILL